MDPGQVGPCARGLSCVLGALTTETGQRWDLSDWERRVIYGAEINVASEKADPGLGLQSCQWQ